MPQNDKNLKLAEYVLERGTCLCGTDLSQIDSATFFIDPIKQDIGMFEKEIKEFVELLESLEIIDNVRYVNACEINEEISGNAYECEVNVQKMKEFIKNGAGDRTVFDEISSQIIFKLKKLSIPKNSKQFYFCKKMYEHEINEWISWDEIYDEMSGTDNAPKGAWKITYDAMSELNKKVDKELGIKKLFDYNKHEFLRTK
jgi:hypothetical protein